MNLDNLKSFYYTSKYQSFTRAAEYLNITQPSVTRQVQDLQEKTGLILINKTGKSFVLTDAGKMLTSMAENIFEIEEKIEESISDYKRQKRGNIAIDTINSFSSYYLPDFMPEFIRNFPDIKISVFAMPNENVIQATSKFENDFGIVSHKVRNTKIISREIFNEKFVLISSPEAPLAKKAKVEPAELDQLPLIFFEKGSGTMDTVERFMRRNRINFKTVCTISDSEAVKNMVRHNAGYALISRKVVEKEVLSGDIVALQIDDSLLSRKFYMIYHKDKFFSENLKSFLDIMFHWAERYAAAREHSDNIKSAAAPVI
ncbi:MAG: LysR family transcriptional regulator [Spirochaetia bacterium]|jgi:DNA-binding transcriptional LysR family regulator|nr:LysR family transcriptional regulator [Spirochaetia bacterium]